MSADLALVPAPLLLAPNLPALAKLVWMVAQVTPGASQSARAAAAGLSRLSVRSATALLRTSGWDPAQAPASAPTVPVPAALLTNTTLGIQARVLYGILQLMPGFSHPAGRATTAELAQAANASPHTITSALAQLKNAEWLITERKNRRDRIRFELTFPGLEQALTALARTERRLEKPGINYGEALMQEYLSLLIDSDQFADNARPGFLLNPRTDERLEFDRFYPPGVAFEFNGPHHEGETEQVSAAESAAQQERDLIKLGICARRGITLVTVRPQDLTLKTMQQKVAGLLPLRDLTGCDLVIDHLETESRRYRRPPKKQKAPASPK